MRNWVIILNWNSWKDTVECLESVFRLDCPEVGVIVCDNASGDESLEMIKGWARGDNLAQSANRELERLIWPPVAKPLSYCEISREDAERRAPRHDAQLILVQNGANLGFAGGNNVGLRHALHDPDAAYFWILNNDTVVDPGALRALVTAMHADDQLGLCGSVLRNYSHPGQVLTLGGRRYSRLSGRTRPVQAAPLETLEARCRPDYIEGASMLARRSFLETVGLMSEDYFLYFEEIDWAMRARGRFRFTYAPESIVYHKVGGSIGSHKDRNQRSALCDFFQARNRLRFTRRYFPWLLPATFVSVLGTAVHRLVNGRRKNAGAVVKGVFAALNPGAARVA